MRKRGEMKCFVQKINKVNINKYTLQYISLDRRIFLQFSHNFLCFAHRFFEVPLIDSTARSTSIIIINTSIK